MINVLVGEDHQLDVVDRVAVLDQLLLQLVEGLARVGAAVDQRERLVLDQIAVDPSHLKWGGYAQAVDSRLAGAVERLLGAELTGRLQDLINPKTSSRRDSMSSRETSDSRFSRSSGSVLDGRRLKCHSG